MHGRPPVQSTTVEATPLFAESSSSLKVAGTSAASPGSTSLYECAAGFPLKLADVVARGQPTAEISRSVVLQSGILSPMVPSAD